MKSIFFSLSLLFLLEKEAAGVGIYEKFSQASEETIDLKTLGGSGGSSDEYSRSESSWSTLKANSPKNIVSKEVYEERKHKHTGDGSDGDRTGESAGEIESFVRRKEKQHFRQELAK
ncbi:hypothetical protein STEG23_035448 [Scotinomys teguina]